MANTSILAAFERMWQHVLAALNNKADASDLSVLQTEVDGKVDKIDGKEFATTEYVDTKAVQSDWDVVDETSMAYIHNKPKISQDSIILKDQVNGYDYVIQMRNGNLVSMIAASGIYVTNYSNKTSYVMGEYFDPTGMVITADCQDGSSKIVDNYTCQQNYLTTSDTYAEVYYNEAGAIHTVKVPVTVTAFDAASVLIDFEYTAEDDGTYTITAWKGTLNGQPSTEMVIPNNGLINVSVG